MYYAISETDALHSFSVYQHILTRFGYKKNIEQCGCRKMDGILQPILIDPVPKSILSLILYGCVLAIVQESELLKSWDLNAL